MIFIMNGPPGSGKDEAALYYESIGARHLRFKDALFQKVMTIFNVERSWFMDGYNDRDKKDLAEWQLDGMSRRQAMIHVSENIIKPHYGKSYFGESLAKLINLEDDFVVSDGGFLEELTPIINKVGAENIVLIQLARDDCSFVNDSRRYISAEIKRYYIHSHSLPIDTDSLLDNDLNLTGYRIYNNGSLHHFRAALLEIYKTEKANNETEARAQGERKQ